jgi:hypothetical protein
LLYDVESRQKIEFFAEKVNKLFLSERVFEDKLKATERISLMKEGEAQLKNFFKNKILLKRL